nr:hypothetical protein [Tanacetum cinerariifolium]
MQQVMNSDVPENSGNPNPTTTSTNPPADHLETLTVETAIPTVSSPVPTACFTDSQEPSNGSNGVEADVSNMETTITASPTPILRIHKDHPKIQIIGRVDTPIQTRNKSKEDETSGILRKFIIEIENLKDLKVKIIRCDNGGELRNKEMSEFCLQKGIKREFSNARTPQQNGVAERVLVNKSQNKTPYELFNGRTLAIGFLKPFGCHVMILNTLDNLGKFEAKGKESYFIRYSMYSKAFRVFNNRTRRVEEILHIEFLENKAIEKGAGLKWLFDIDSLTKSMNYVPVNAGINSTNLSGTKDAASQEVKKDVSSLRYIALPNWVHDALLEYSSSKPQDDCSTDVPKSSGISNPTATSTNLPANQLETQTRETPIPIFSSPVPTSCFNDSLEPSSDTRLILKRVANQVETPSLDNILTLTNQFEDILGVTTNSVDSDGVEVDNVWTLVDCPKGVRPIGTKWVLKNKKDERGIVIKNKSRLVAQGHTQEEGIDYDELFAPIARIKAIRLFLAYASFMGFTDPEFLAKVYKVEKAMYGLHQAPRAWYGTLSKYLLTNGFQRGTIDQTLFIRRQRGDFILVQVYVDDIIFGSSNLQLCKEFEALMHEKFQMSDMGELNFFLGLQVLQKEECNFLSQDKYVGYILKKFGYSDVRSSNTPMDKENPWGKDKTRKDVDLHPYRSMIGSLMYLTASRPDIMFAVCACARHQVTPKECHLHAVKRIFRYLKGHPKLGPWYPKESPFDLVAYSDSDYGGATQDSKSTTGGCQFFGRKLISWQCKKQKIVATSTIEAKYVAAASCCGQVLWIQNQLLDYEYNFMNTTIYIDNNSAICIVKNPSYHSKTKHIEIRHHFIRDCFEKKLTSVDHIHTDKNVADLLTKPFDAGRFQYLVRKLFSLLGKLSTVSVFLGFRLTFAGTSKYWGVLRILMISFRLIPLSEHNVDFHLIVDFVEASPLSLSFSGRIVPLFDTMLIPQGEGSGTPTEPHHTPSPEGQTPLSTNPSSPTLPSVTTTHIPTITSSDTPPFRQYTRRTKIAQSSVLPPAADKPASPLRDVSQGEACPTDSSFGADQDKENIAKTSTLPYDSAPRVTSPAADEGSMQPTLAELMDLCTILQRQHSEMVSKFEAQELEIYRLKAKVKLLEDREGVVAARSGVDALIKGRNLDEGEAAAERVSNDTEEMATILTSIDSATVLASGVAKVSTGSRSIPTAGPPAAEVPTGNDVVPTASPIFATATMVTPYTRRKGKETMVESETSKKKKVQEQIDAQIKDFIPVGSKEEAERFKRKGIRFEQESAKRLKTSKEVHEEVKSLDEVPKERLWALVKESLSIRKPISNKEMELWVELKRLYEPDDKGQLWTHTQNLIHALVEWKLYDMCEVHQVTSKDKESFMLVEKDYPLRKGLAIVMIYYKLQVENYSQMENDLILKIYKVANYPSQQDPKSSHDDGSKTSSDNGKKVDEDPRKENECNDQEKEDNVNGTNNVNTVSLTVNVAGANEDNELPFDPIMHALEDVSIFNFSSVDKDEGTVANMNNLDTTIQVSPIPTIRIHKDHPLNQVIGDLQSAT